MARGARWAVVPARYASQRLPGKPLADLGGRPLLHHVWERVTAAAVFDRILVATDDDRIAAVARGFGAEVVQTGPAPSGTHRVALAVGEARPEVVVNVQGDQPLLDPAHLARLVALPCAGGITTAMTRWRGEGEPGPEIVRVDVDGDDRALDFRRRGPVRWVHVGLYAFWGDALQHAAAAPRTARTRAADLEQLAWLDAGLPIRVARIGPCAPGVDTPDQLDRVRALLEGRTDGGA